MNDVWNLMKTIKIKKVDNIIDDATQEDQQDESVCLCVCVFPSWILLPNNMDDSVKVGGKNWINFFSSHTKRER